LLMTVKRQIPLIPPFLKGDVELRTFDDYR